MAIGAISLGRPMAHKASLVTVPIIWLGAVPRYARQPLLAAASDGIGDTGNRSIRAAIRTGIAQPKLAVDARRARRDD